MPPKKENAQKKEPLKEDDDGLPKNNVTFTFRFQVTQKDVKNIILMWEWLAQDGSKTVRYDAGLIDTWSKGEQETIFYEKKFDEIKIDENICKQLCQKQFYIYFVNSEDCKIKQKLFIDYSCLVSDKTATPTNLLQPLMRHYINPMLINIIGAKDMPISQDKHKYMPIYAQYEFIDKSIQKTQGIVLTQDKIKWDFKHTFLVGLMDQDQLRDFLNSQLLKIEVHDHDLSMKGDVLQCKELINISQLIQEEEIKMNPPEIVIQDQKTKKKDSKPPPAQQQQQQQQKESKNVPEKKDTKKDTKKKVVDIKQIEPIDDMADANIEIIKNDFGIAAYVLSDLLKPNVRSIKLRAPIVPVSKFSEFEQQQNLDLNTTAKKTQQDIIEYMNYMESCSFLLISVDLDYAVGTFVMPSNAEIKLHIAKQAQPVFERVIYYMPYKSKDFVVKLQSAILEINKKTFNMEQEDDRNVRIRVLTQQELNNKDLDYISGVEIIDGTFRIYIVEGLSEGAIRRLTSKIPIDSPNTDTFKILRNHSLLFAKRIYSCFNIDIKRMKFSQSLQELLQNFEVYLRNKCPDNIRQSLFKLSDLCKADSLKNVAENDLFLTTEELLSIERRYANEIPNVEDYYGYEMEVKTIKQKQRKSEIAKAFGQSKQFSKSPTITFSKIVTLSDQELSTQFSPNHATAKKAIQLPRIQQQNQGTAKKFNQGSNILFQQTIKKKKHEHYTLQMKEKLDQQQDDNIFKTSLSGIHNQYFLQMEELRKKVRKDKDYFYTYSMEYLSQSVDPYDVEEFKKQEDKAERKRLSKKPKFIPHAVRSTQEKLQHPKQLDQQTQKEIQTISYHEQKGRENKVLQPSRMPLDKEHEFITRVNGVDLFSQPENHYLTVEQAKQQRQEDEEKKLKAQKEYEERFLGQKQFNIKYPINCSSQIDKLQNLREGEAKKHGLIMNSKQLSQHKINMKRQIQDLPVSIFYDQKYEDQKDIFERKIDPTKIVSNFNFNLFEGSNPMSKSCVAKHYFH